MKLESHTEIIVSRNLAVADLGSEAVLLDPNSGVYFGLNGVAARILDLAQSGSTIGRIVDKLLEEYEVERDRLSADVEGFVMDLKQRGLVTTVASPHHS